MIVMKTHYKTHKHEWYLERIYNAGVRPQTEVYKCKGCTVMKIKRGDFVHYNYINGGIVDDNL